MNRRTPVPGVGRFYRRWHRIKNRFFDACLSRGKPPLWKRKLKQTERDEDFLLTSPPTGGRMYP